MKPAGFSTFRMTENLWRGILIALSCLVLLFTVWCLSSGITTIFMHLYYFPIVLLAYHYRWKGFSLASLLSLAYVALVIIFAAGQADVILGAFYRFLVFVGIAAVIAYLSDRLALEKISAQESAEIRERYISLAPAIILVLDRDGAITFLNRKGGEILGCIPEDVAGKSWFEMFLPEKERERVKKVFSQLIAGEVEPNRVIENPVLTCSGTEKIIRWYNTVLHDENGSITGILGFGEDITEEKWAQNALREMQQFQESVITNANVWISVLDPDGTILVWNDAAEAISGYKKTGVLGKKSVWKQLYPDTAYRKKVTEEIRRIIVRDEYLENFETEIRCADASKKTVIWNTRGMRDKSGVITGYIAIGRDVTAQKSAEFRAGESSRFLAAMINTLPIPIFFKDAGGKYLGCNPPFEAYIGIKRDSLVGKTVYDIAPKDLAEKYAAADREIFDNPVQQHYEMQVQYADGSRHDVIFYKAPFFDKDGSVGGLIGAFLDITDRKSMESRLALQNAQMSLAQQMARIGYWSYDIATGIPVWSDVMFTVFGQDPGRGVPHYIQHQDFIHPDDWDKFDKAVKGAISGTPYNLEIRVIFPDGSLHYVQTRGYPRNNPDNRITELFGISQDVTERKMAEEALQKSEEKFRIVADYTMDWEYWLAPDGTYSYMSPSCERITGYSAGEFYKNPALFDGIVHPDDMAAYRGHMDLSAVSTSPESVEYRIIRKDGGIRWISHICQPMYGRNGELLGRRSSNRDDTERKLAELALQESEEKYRAFFSTSQDCVFITTADGRWVDFNEAAVNLFGYESRDDLLTVTIPQLYANPRDRDAHIRYIREKGFSFEYPVDLRKKDGTVINVLITTVPRKDESGNILGFQGTIRDITEKKATQDRIDELLRVQEEQLRIINTSPAVAFLWKAEENWPVETVSSNISQFGYSADDFVSGRVVYSSIIHPDDLRRVTAEVESKSKNNIDEFGQIYRIFGKDGSEYWIDDYTHIRRDEKGTITHFEGLILDITDRKRAEEALRTSEGRLQTLVRTIPDLIWLKDVDGVYLSCNPMFERFFGAREIDIIGKTDYDFVDRKLADFFREHDRNAMAAGRPTSNEEWITFADDGHRALLDTTKTPMYDSQGALIGVLGIGRDITDRKRAEDEIKRSIERFRTVMDSIDALVYVSDMQTYELLFLNKYGKDIWGEIEGKVCWQEIQSGQNGPCQFCTNDRLLDKDGTPNGIYQWEFQNTVNGRWYDCRDSAIRWLDGRIVRLEIATDITGRKQVEEALRESRQLFSDIISFLPDPTFVIDKNGTVLAWNRAIELLSGVPAGEMIGKGDHEYSLWLYGKRRPILIDLVLYPDQDAGRLNYTGIRWDHNTVIAQTDLALPDGRKPVFSLVASPLFDAEGKITGAIESMRDITRLKEAEAELARINQNLEKIVQDRTRALEEEIAQRMRAEKDVQAALDYTRSVIEANPDLMVVLDEKGIILDINAAGEPLSGISKEQLIGTSYFGYLVEDGTLADRFSRLLNEGKIEDIVHLRNVDGHVTPLSIHATVVRGIPGIKDRIIVSAHDITRQKQDEEAIKASLNEKVILLREIHHRVKNNLQIIISLTNLQMRQTDDPGVKQVMSETQNRVRAMSLVHEKLYRSESLARIDFADYTRFLATQLFSFYGMDTRRVRLDLGMEPTMVDINTAVPLGLIMNELVSNALKHAFPEGRSGTISISSTHDDSIITLVVRDDGIGIPSDLDWKNTVSLGMRLVISLVDQINGILDLDRENGTTFTITVRKEPGSGGTA
jgi:PAS domain S-box-containing protein